MSAHIEERLLDRLESVAQLGRWRDYSAASEAKRAPWKFMKASFTDQVEMPVVNAILVADDARAVNKLKRELGELDLSAEAHSRLAITPMTSLGMVSVSLPAFRSVVECFAELESVSVIGDGDARSCLTLPPKPKDAPFHTGGLGAVLGRMVNSPDLLERLRADLEFRPESIVRVAVLDTGIDASLPQFISGNGALVISARDFTEGQLGPVCRSGHGTHVAGLIAGLGDRANPLWAGVATNARLLDAQVLEADGSGVLFNILKGLSWAVESGADIANMSLGTFDPSGGHNQNSLEWMAVAAAEQQGVLCVCAAGNDGLKFSSPSISSPSDSPKALCVGAVNADSRMASFSSRGPAKWAVLSGDKPNLAAPGVALVGPRSRSSDQPVFQDSNWTVMSGTSMATPIVSGFVALGLGYARHKGWEVNPKLLRSALMESSFRPPYERSEHVGAGVPNLNAFVSVLESKCSRIKKTKIPQTETSGHGNRRRSESIKINVSSDWAGMEDELVTAVKSRVETTLQKDGRRFFSRAGIFARGSRFEIKWQERDSSLKLRAYVARGLASKDEIERFPLNREVWGAVTDGGTVAGRILIQYVCDYEAFFKGKDGNVSQKMIDEIVQSGFSRGASFVAALGHLPRATQIPLENVAYLSFGVEQKWTYRDRVSDREVWRLFYPKSDVECLAEIEENLATIAPALVEQVVAATNLPPGMVDALGQTSTRFELRPNFRENHDFFFPIQKVNT